MNESNLGRAIAVAAVIVGLAGICQALEGASIPSIGVVRELGSGGAEACDPGPCTGLPWQEPYRSRFESARPMKEADIPQVGLLLINSSEPAAFAPESSLRSYGSATGFAFKRGFVTRAGVIHWAGVPTAWQITEFWLRTEGHPLAFEEGEARISGERVRITFRILGDYLLAKREECPEGSQWREIGYYFAHVRRDWVVNP